MGELLILKIHIELLVHSTYCAYIFSNFPTLIFPRSISFILHCGSLVGNCVASNSASITVYYKEASSSIWNTITTYHPAGDNIMYY